MFDLAMMFLKIISNHTDQEGKKIQIRIGIHSGKCMMGVIGYHKPQFSLIGDTVNKTSRVCSTGRNGHIMLSKEAFTKLKNFDLDKQYAFKKVMTFMKGKGEEPVYHIFKKP